MKDPGPIDHHGVVLGESIERIGRQIGSISREPRHRLQRRVVAKEPGLVVVRSEGGDGG